jgi:hypothetical protein
MSNSNHPENPHLAGTPAGGPSVYPSELGPHNRLWHADSLPYPGAGFPATANPDYVYGPRFSVPLLLNSQHSVYLMLLQAPGDTTYRADAPPLYPWRMHSDALKTMIRNLMLQINSEVVEVRRETYGPNRSRVTVVFETPDEI